MKHGIEMFALGINQRMINVGLGEMSVTRDTTVVLSCIGLGSCIAVCVYDPFTKSGGLAHMLLPLGRKDNDISSPSVKYIDTGVPLFINQVIKQSSGRENLIVKVIGGATMLQVPGGGLLDIGQRNIQEIKAALAKEKIPILGWDVGGTAGRSVHFFLDTGRIMIKALNGPLTEM
ncbi:MAG TPA: chemotaxis protein CheD [Dehalococcoidales bacterium]|nr:chemotaxis protein CheD [Dehalococcoidales bacterium]